MSSGHRHADRSVANPSTLPRIMPATAGTYPVPVADQHRPPPEPLDPPMVPFAVGGIALWLVAGLVLLFTGPRAWVWICLAGALWGIPGLLVMLRHDANRRVRRARVTDDRTAPAAPRPAPNPVDG